MEIKLSLSLISNIFLYLKSLYRKLYNWAFRPHILVELRNTTFTYTTQDNKEHNSRHPSIEITNQSKTTLVINPNKVMVNNEKYMVIVQSDQDFSRLSPNSSNHWKCESNVIYNHYSKHWSEITDNRNTIRIEPSEKLCFPLKLLKSNVRIITDIKKNSRLFFPGRKTSVSLSINNRDYEYAIKKMKCYEVFLNFLAFKL